MPDARDLMDRLPDLDYIRRELGRNLRERDLLKKLLKIAEEKAGIERLTAESEASNADPR